MVKKVKKDMIFLLLFYKDNEFIYYLQIIIS